MDGSGLDKSTSKGKDNLTDILRDWIAKCSRNGCDISTLALQATMKYINGPSEGVDMGKLLLGGCDVTEQQARLLFQEVKGSMLLSKIDISGDAQWVNASSTIFEVLSDQFIHTTEMALDNRLAEVYIGEIVHSGEEQWRDQTLKEKIEALTTVLNIENYKALIRRAYKTHASPRSIYYMTLQKVWISLFGYVDSVEMQAALGRGKEPSVLTYDEMQHSLLISLANKKIIGSVSQRQLFIIGKIIEENKGKVDSLSKAGGNAHLDQTNIATTITNTDTAAAYSSAGASTAPIATANIENEESGFTAAPADSISFDSSTVPEPPAVYFAQIDASVSPPIPPPTNAASAHSNNDNSSRSINNHDNNNNNNNNNSTIASSNNKSKSDTLAPKKPATSGRVAAMINKFQDSSSGANNGGSSAAPVGLKGGFAMVGMTGARSSPPVHSRKSVRQSKADISASQAEALVVKRDSIGGGIDLGLDTTGADLKATSNTDNSPSPNNMRRPKKSPSPSRRFSSPVTLKEAKSSTRNAFSSERDASDKMSPPSSSFSSFSSNTATPAVIVRDSSVSSNIDSSGGKRSPTSNSKSEEPIEQLDLLTQSNNSVFESALNVSSSSIKNTPPSADSITRLGRSKSSVTTPNRATPNRATSPSFKAKSSPFSNYSTPIGLGSPMFSPLSIFSASASASISASVALSKAEQLVTDSARSKSPSRLMKSPTDVSPTRKHSPARGERLPSSFGSDIENELPLEILRSSVPLRVHSRDVSPTSPSSSRISSRFTSPSASLKSQNLLSVRESSDYTSGAVIVHASAKKAGENLSAMFEEVKENEDHDDNSQVLRKVPDVSYLFDGSVTYNKVFRFCDHKTGSVELLQEKLSHLDIPVITSMILRKNLLNSLDQIELSRFSKLVFLDVASNLIDYSFDLKSFPQSLQSLDISHNNLSDLNSFIYFSSLKFLNVSNNRITSLCILPASLQDLNLSHNLLSSTKELRILSFCKKLLSIQLKSNPLLGDNSKGETQKVRTYVRSVIPSLRECDRVLYPGVKVEDPNANQVEKPKYSKEEQIEMDRKRSVEEIQRKKDVLAQTRAILDEEDRVKKVGGNIVLRESDLLGLNRRLTVHNNAYLHRAFSPTKDRYHQNNQNVRSNVHESRTVNVKHIRQLCESPSRANFKKQFEGKERWLTPAQVKAVEYIDDWISEALGDISKAILSFGPLSELSVASHWDEDLRQNFLKIYQSISFVQKGIVVPYNVERAVDTLSVNHEDSLDLMQFTIEKMVYLTTFLVDIKEMVEGFDHIYRDTHDFLTDLKILQSTTAGVFVTRRVLEPAGLQFGQTEKATRIGKISPSKFRGDGYMAADLKTRPLELSKAVIDGHLASVKSRYQESLESFTLIQKQRLEEKKEEKLANGNSFEGHGFRFFSSKSVNKLSNINIRTSYSNSKSLKNASMNRSRRSNEYSVVATRRREMSIASATENSSMTSAADMEVMASKIESSVAEVVPTVAVVSSGPGERTGGYREEGEGSGGGDGGGNFQRKRRTALMSHEAANITGTFDIISKQSLGFGNYQRPGYTPYSSSESNEVGLDQAVEASNETVAVTSLIIASSVDENQLIIDKMNARLISRAQLEINSLDSDEKVSISNTNNNDDGDIDNNNGNKNDDNNYSNSIVSINETVAVNEKNVALAAIDPIGPVVPIVESVSKVVPKVDDVKGGGGGDQSATTASDANPIYLVRKDAPVSRLDYITKFVGKPDASVDKKIEESSSSSAGELGKPFVDQTKSDPVSSDNFQGVLENAEKAANNRVDSNSAWISGSDDQGNVYFYNTLTAESVWELPPGASLQPQSTEYNGRDSSAGDVQDAASSSSNVQSNNTPGDYDGGSSKNGNISAKDRLKARMSEKNKSSRNLL